MSQKLSTCSNCVLDGEVKLDLVDGVCQYCRFAEEMANERRAQKLELPWIISDIKDQGKEYDVLIGLSGGVDSSYALHKVVEQGLNPLCFSVDNGWQSQQANENIMRLVEGLKVPFYRYNIDLEAFKELQKAFIRSGVKNIEIPTDHILMATTYEMAKKYKIKTIISGGNWQTEGTMPVDYGYNARDLTYIKAIGDISKLPHMSLLKYLWHRNVLGIKIVNILDYYDYNRENSIKILVDKYGYKPYGEKHGESSFTKWFQDWYLPWVWDLDKRKPHLTSLIHSGQMTREEAIKELESREKLEEHSDEVPVMLGISGEDLCKTGPYHVKEYPTFEKWDKRWVKFFNVLKRYGYLR